MVKGFGPIMANMTDDDIASYVDQTVLTGEFATLRNIPEIAEAIKQARMQDTSQEMPPQTATP